MKSMIKSFNLTALATVVISSTLLVAPQVDAKGRHGGDKGFRAEAKFNRMDTDGDQLLTLTEMTDAALAKVDKKFSRKDADEDGLLSFEEATTGRHGNKPDLTEIAEELVQCIADVKAETGNEDIVVPSVEDFKTAQQRFDDIDTSGDGFIDQAEMEASATAKAATKFAAMDSDESGDVTLEEYTAAKEKAHANRKVVRQCARELLDDSDV